MRLYRFDLYVFAKYSGRDVTQVPLGAEGVRGNSSERRNASAFGSSSEFEVVSIKLMADVCISHYSFTILV